MFKFFVIASLTVALVVSATVKEQAKTPPATDSKSQASAQVQQFEGGYGVEEYHNVVDHAGGGGGGNKAYGAELTSLAHHSALHAKSAALSQQAAGSQAAFTAKSSLAQAALGAASTAQAALVGKQIIVQTLNHHLHEAEHRLKAAIHQFQQSSSAARLAEEASERAHAQIAGLSAALTAAQATATAIAQAASETGSVNASQQAAVEEAEREVKSLAGELEHALRELHETEVATGKATAAAHEAQANAEAAASVVQASTGGDQGHQGLQGHHY